MGEHDLQVHGRCCVCGQRRIFPGARQEGGERQIALVPPLSSATSHSAVLQRPRPGSAVGRVQRLPPPAPEQITQPAGGFSVHGPGAVSAPPAAPSPQAERRGRAPGCPRRPGKRRPRAPRLRPGRAVAGADNRTSARPGGAPGKRPRRGQALAERLWRERPQK